MFLYNYLILVNSHSIACNSSNPGDFLLMKMETHLLLLTALLCLSSNLPSVGLAAAPQTTKQTPFRKQEDCASKPMSDEVLSEDASVNPGPRSSTQSDRPQNPLETGSPTPTSIACSFPYLNVSGLTPEQQEGLRIRLCVESEDIVHKFGHLHSRIYESLYQRNVPVDKLVTHLLSLGAFDPVYKDSQKPVLQTFFQELQNAGSIEKVLYIIRDYISFFNYHVIEHIVNELGTFINSTL